jgi:hypothetical protein
VFQHPGTTHNGGSETIRHRLLKSMYASSSIGRVAVSKTAGWGFESLLACHLTVRVQEFE